MPEEILQTRRIYDGRVVNLRVDQVRLPSGVEATREIIEHPGAVAIVPILEGDRVVLVRQYRSAVAEDLLEIPAGTLKIGEDPLECAKRELIEETNYSAGRIDQFMFSWVAPGYSAEAMYYFLASDLAPCEGVQDEDEDVSVEIVELADILKLIQSGNIRDTKTIAGLLSAQRILEMRGHEAV